MNHEEFIKELKTYGVNVDTKYGGQDHTSSWKLTLNLLQIPKDAYELFGYYCGGVYSQCNRTSKEEFTLEDIKAAVKKALEIQANDTLMYRRDITYWDVKEFLQGFGKTKVDVSAISRVLAILDDRYQEIAQIKRVSVENEIKEL